MSNRGSVILTPEEVAYHLKRFNTKRYTNRDEVPMSPRQISELEDKLGLRKKQKEP